MQSIDFTLVISNLCEHVLSTKHAMDETEVHRVILTNISWIPENTYALINDAMRQRLALGLRETLPSHSFNTSMNDIVSPDRFYSTCQDIFLSRNTYDHSNLSSAIPVLIPDLPVDFVLGTDLFRKLGLVWNSRLNRRLTPREQQEERVREANRNACRNLL
ncbi:unnamed protein product [Adineta ricciae]|uniref:Uncharacterized protein n=1 Tax=Adineta ricciae TaxID=249248 RepID=A0A815ZZP2_ADIRI|nr:unnamed protein product [Adineta ricciae]